MDAEDDGSRCTSALPNTSKDFSIAFDVPNRGGGRFPPKMACELTDATPMVLNAKSATDDTNSAHLLRNKVFEEEETSKDDASFSSIGARSKRPRSFARVPNRESIDDDITERERERVVWRFLLGGCRRPIFPRQKKAEFE